MANILPHHGIHFKCAHPVRFAIAWPTKFFQNIFKFIPKHLNVIVVVVATVVVVVTTMVMVAAVVATSMVMVAVVVVMAVMVVAVVVASGDVGNDGGRW